MPAFSFHHGWQQTQDDFKRAKNELTDATDFMEAQQLELTRWKKDVIGFRDEIRQSQAAQLRALIKVLKLLGAEQVNLSGETVN